MDLSKHYCGIWKLQDGKWKNKGKVDFGVILHSLWLCPWSRYIRHVNTPQLSMPLRTRPSSTIHERNVQRDCNSDYFLCLCFESAYVVVFSLCSPHEKDWMNPIISNTICRILSRNFLPIPTYCKGSDSNQMEFALQTPLLLVCVTVGNTNSLCFVVRAQTETIPLLSVFRSVPKNFVIRNVIYAWCYPLVVRLIQP